MHREHHSKKKLASTVSCSSFKTETSQNHIVPRSGRANGQKKVNNPVYVSEAAECMYLAESWNQTKPIIVKEKRPVETPCKLPRCRHARLPQVAEHSVLLPSGNVRCTQRYDTIWSASFADTTLRRRAQNAKKCLLNMEHSAT